MFALLLSAFLPALRLAADDPAEATCHNADNTMVITDRFGKLSSQQRDRRINRADQSALRASASDAHRNALVRAQRA